MENEIVKVEQAGFLAPAVTVDDALRAYQAKKDLIDKIMRSGVDFGVIPGTTKPTLYKAGAEKATSFFGLSTKFFDVVAIEDFTGKDHDGEPLFYYRRACELWRGDRFVARAEGSCNSWEKKYRYRASERVCPKCNQPTIIIGKKEYGGGFICFAKKGGCGAKFGDGDTSITSQVVGQVKNPDIAEVANTVLKMADKRALIAVTLIATGMSEYFTQDVEDFINAEVVHEETTDAAKSESAKTLPLHVESKQPAPQKQVSVSPEHAELVKQFAASFNGIPAEKRGQAKPCNTAKATDDEIRAAIQFNLNLAKEESNA